MPFRHALRRRCAVVLLAVGYPAALPSQATAVAPASTRGAPDSIADFAGLVQRLSDAGGYFDTDNLISNEQGYQQVLGAMERLGVRGGAYIGVGPDQNYTYIARVRPRIAFVVDIRRDNMLEHLLFKALFARASNRAEYLALWTGKPVPTDIQLYASRSAPSLVAWVDSTPSTSASAARAKALVREEARKSGIELTAQDMATITRFHDAFIAAGLSLRFNSAGRPPQWYHPTLRQLILEHDAEGRQRSYLASEDDFQFVKSMHRRNLIVPVTGDLSGARALPGIARVIADRGERVSALYVSNVEDYLIRDGRFAAYMTAVRLLPREANAVVIRSYFGGGTGHPEATPEYYATQLLQRLATLAGDSAIDGVMRYRELVSRSTVPLRKP